MIINTILLQRLRNAGLVQFFTDVQGTVTSNITGPALAAIQDELAAFINSKTALSQNYQLDPSSPLTQEVVAADLRRDDAYSGIRFLAEGYSRHFTPAVRAAGARVLHAIAIYGNVDAMAYQDETAAITNLVADLETKPELAQAANDLNLNGWLAELKAANIAFNQKYLARTAQMAADDTGTNIATLRKPAINAWYALRDQIAANYKVARGAAPWSTAVGQLNSTIDQYNDTLARRGGNNDDDAGDDTPPAGS